MIDALVRRAWGEANAFLHRTRQLRWVDLLVLAGLVGVALGIHRIAGEWSGPQRPEVAIDLSPWALPKYAMFSLSRGLIAYALSLAFTLVYGYWAAKDRVAERVLIPLLDILQSIPILGFMPGLVLGLVRIFPTTNTGLELAAVLMMFTGQVWNMTFSFYHSLRAVPADLGEVGRVYRFSWWERLKWIELPFATLGLVWNSMMSMAGGWFFLMINEAFVLGAHDFRLPGLGSYMSVAVARGNVPAMLWAILAMVLMIVSLDQLLWRPVVVWAQKFRVEEGGATQAMGSWFFDWLHHSRLVAFAHHLLRRAGELRERRAAAAAARLAARGPRRVRPGTPGGATLALAAFVLVLAALLFGGVRLLLLLRSVTPATWGLTLLAAVLTLARVLASTALGTLWTLPVGLAIGLSPRLSRILQPVIQIAASFPAPMLFPIVIALMHAAGMPLGTGSIVLMLLGTQWYILFNVIAGAMAIPADLKEAARSYRLGLWARMRTLYIPAVFSYLVTGWVTAAGGAWNASIVSEYVSFKGRVATTLGVGSLISRAAENGDLPGLASGVLILSTMVMLFNRNVWRRCYRLAEARYSLNR